jgi:serine/threonine-protein kinase PpkA
MSGIGRRALGTAAAAAALAGGLGLPVAQPADAREALLIPGKRTLRQRVLSRPGAVPVASPGAAPGAGAPLSPLTPLYVYARRTDPDGAAWLEVGRAARGAPLGWIPAERAIEWRHTMTAVFHNPAGRERTLFFRERDQVVAMLAGADPAAEARRLAEIAARPPVPADFPVIAAEPATHVDIARQFYLLPILQAEEIVFQDGRDFRVVEVASVPIGGTPAEERAFTVGVAFVVDTTLSMDPYIERVRANLTRIVRGIAGTPLGSRARFALVGFQNSLEVQPRLDYLTRIFATFEDGANPDAFVRKIGAMRATNVDSLSFDEDSFAGIVAAMEQLDWSDLAARYIVLVTDAGNRRDRYSSTGLGPAELREVARARGTAIFALHVKTPQGRRNWASAEQQYLQLTAWPNFEPFYFPVENGDAEAFGRQVERLTQALLRVAETAGPGGAPPPPAGGDIGAQAALAGHAMRLAWLGRRDRAAAPDVVRGWAADRYRPGADNLEIRVLLTRNQLNDLAQAVRIIIDEGRAHILDEGGVFERLRTVAAHLARDPARLRERGVETLGAVLGEYLDDLPYVSEIASMDRDTWRRMGAGRQTEILDTLEQRLRAYEEFSRARELWVSFDGGRDPGEEMFPVPLALLP